MDIDGSQIQILSSDKVTDINIAGDWIFYNLMDRNLNNLHYKMKTDGSERQHVDGREGAGNEYSSDGQ